MMDKNIKTIAFCNYYDELNIDNFMFENDNAPIGDDLLTPFIELRRIASAQNINIGTVNIFNPSVVDVFVFIDMPEHHNKYFKYGLLHKKPMYLVILESRLTRKQNYDPSNYRFFHKIFTYNDDYIDTKKFIKLNYAFSFPSVIPCNYEEKDKLCVMIAGNKKSNDPNELYSKREEIIRWFENNHPNDFDLYGVGWDKYTFNGIKLLRLLNRFNFLRSLCSKKYNCYRGPVERKKAILKKSKFSICYENIGNVPGYITEKIFDSLISGCVPIYWGADNILDHVPGNCFIDKRDFKSYAELYAYIYGMSKAEYLSYIENIEKFFHSEQAYKFSIKCFSETLIQEIVYE